MDRRNPLIQFFGVGIPRGFEGLFITALAPQTQLALFGLRAPDDPPVRHVLRPPRLREDGEIQQDQDLLPARAADDPRRTGMHRVIRMPIAELGVQLCVMSVAEVISGIIERKPPFTGIAKGVVVFVLKWTLLLNAH